MSMFSYLMNPNNGNYSVPAIVFVFKMAATLEFSMSHASANIIDRKLIIVYMSMFS